MTPQLLWLVAVILQIVGILFIGDEVIMTRREIGVLRSRQIVEDGAGHPENSPAMASHKPWKSVLGIGLLLSGLGVALIANRL